MQILCVLEHGTQASQREMSHSNWSGIFDGLSLMLDRRIVWDTPMAGAILFGSNLILVGSLRRVAWVS